MHMCSYEMTTLKKVRKSAYHVSYCANLWNRDAEGDDGHMVTFQRWRKIKGAKLNTLTTVFDRKNLAYHNLTDSELFWILLNQ